MAAKKRKYNGAAQRAHQRNVERAQYRAKAEKRKAFIHQYRKHLMIGIPAVIVLIVGIWLICKATIGPGGSIPNFFGHLQGVKADWIVANQGTTSDPRYYKMGTFAAPEGFTVDPEYHIASDELAKTLYYKADDADAPVQTVYVAGVSGHTAAEMAETVRGYGLYGGEAVQHEGTLGGQEAVWLMGKINDDQEAIEAANAAAANGEEVEEPELVIGHEQMTIYVDSVQGGCILVYLNSTSSTPVEDIPSDEAFLEVAEKLMAGLKPEK